MTSCSPTSTTTATSMWPAPLSPGSPWTMRSTTAAAPSAPSSPCPSLPRPRIVPRSPPATSTATAKPISWPRAATTCSTGGSRTTRRRPAPWCSTAARRGRATLTVSVESNVPDATELRTRDGGGMWGVWQPYSAAAAHTFAAGDVASRSVQVQYRDAGDNVLALSDTIGVDTVRAVGGPTTCSPGWQPGPVVVTIDRERRDQRRGRASTTPSRKATRYVVAGDAASIVFRAGKRGAGHGRVQVRLPGRGRRRRQPVARRTPSLDPRSTAIPPRTTDTGRPREAVPRGLRCSSSRRPTSVPASPTRGFYWVNESDPRFYDGWFHRRGRDRDDTVPLRRQHRRRSASGTSPSTRWGTSRRCTRTRCVWARSGSSRRWRGPC